MFDKTVLVGGGSFYPVVDIKSDFLQAKHETPNRYD